MTETRVIGVEVGAFVDGSGVGRISPAKNTTRMDSDPVGATFFIFSAEKPGTITVVFQGKVNTRVLLGLEFGGNTVTAAVSLTVEDCKYKVTTFSRWRVPGPANLSILASIQNAGMTEVGGGLYKGTASVKWVFTNDRVGDCISTVTAPPSQAELTGQVYGPEKFVVTVLYDRAMVSNIVDCGGV